MYSAFPSDTFDNFASEWNLHYTSHMTVEINSTHTKAYTPPRFSLIITHDNPHVLSVSIKHSEI